MFEMFVLRKYICELAYASLTNQRCPEEISYILRIAVLVVTNVNPPHLNRYTSKEYRPVADVVRRHRGRCVVRKIRAQEIYSLKALLAPDVGEEINYFCFAKREGKGLLDSAPVVR